MDKLIDYALGLSFCADIEDIYVEIMNMFCDERDEKYTELEQLLNAKDWANYTIKIHALKTNAKNIGSNVLFDKCLELEMASKKVEAGEDVDAQIAFIEEKHVSTMALYDEVVKAAKVYISSR